MLVYQAIWLYRNVGYSAQDRTVPPIGSNKFPEADYMFENVRMQKTGVVYKVDLPIPYAIAIGLTYLEVYNMQYDPWSMFGWIRQVIQIAGQDDVCTIEWEVDYWRTYQKALDFNSGTIIQIDQPTADSLQPYSGYDIIKPQRWTYDSKIEYTISYNMSWLVISYLTDQSQQKYLTTPIITDKNPYSTKVIYHPDSTDRDEYNIPYLSEIDYLVENIGIDPAKIQNQYIIPFCPNRNALVLWHDSSNNLTIGAGSAVVEIKKAPDGQGILLVDDSVFYVSQTYFDPSQAVFGTGQLPFSTDVETFFVVDMLGNIIHNMPYQPQLSTSEDTQISLAVNFSNTNCEVFHKFYRTYDSENISRSRYESRRIAYTPPIQPIFTNAWNSYVYSGQRDYDRRSAEIQNSKQLEKGLASGQINQASGAVAGQVVGSVVPGIGTQIGAAGGQIIGGLVSFIGGAQSDLSNSQIEADKQRQIQSEREKQIQQEQAASITSQDLISALRERNSRAFLTVIKMVPDQVSLAEYNARIQNFGKKLNYDFGADFDSTLRNYLTLSDPNAPAARPIQIVNLSCSGYQPIQAIEKIKEKLQAGVYIVEKN